jgi:hypothetical protein
MSDASGGYRTWPNQPDRGPVTAPDAQGDDGRPPAGLLFIATEIRPEALLYGGDPCPRCGAELGYDESGEEREPFLIHPEPRCGWIPDGYPARAR